MCESTSLTFQSTDISNVLIFRGGFEEAIVVVFVVAVGEYVRIGRALSIEMAFEVSVVEIPWYCFGFVSEFWDPSTFGLRLWDWRYGFPTPFLPGFFDE
jgi:hypothetical protein